jgi:hypothetical protein
MVIIEAIKAITSYLRKIDLIKNDLWQLASPELKNQKKLM